MRPAILNSDIVPSKLHGTAIKLFDPGIVENAFLDMTVLKIYYPSINDWRLFATWTIFPEVTPMLELIRHTFDRGILLAAAYFQACSNGIVPKLDSETKAEQETSQKADLCWWRNFLLALR